MPSKENLGVRSAWDTIFKTLKNQEDAKVLVIISDDANEFAAVLDQIRERDMVGSYYLVATDGWPTNDQTFMDKYKDDIKGNYLVFFFLKTKCFLFTVLLLVHCVFLSQMMIEHIEKYFVRNLRYHYYHYWYYCYHHYSVIINITVIIKIILVYSVNVIIIILVNPVSRICLIKLK